MGASPAHMKSQRRHTARWLVAAIVVVSLALVAGGVALMARQKDPNASASPSPKILPLAVVGSTPANGAANVPSSSTVTVALSTPLDPKSPMPTFTPPVSGTWAPVSPTELQFTTGGPLVPGSQETLTVPGGPSGIVGTQGQHLTASYTSSFTVAPGSTLRLQQLLAQLGYLPLSFTPVTQPTSPEQEADPQQGTFAWRWPDQPASLTSLWVPGADNAITRGAVMSFEDEHGLTTDGIAGPEVWTALLQAAGAGQDDPQPYGYVYVSESLPESATVYQNGGPRSTPRWPTPASPRPPPAGHVPGVRPLPGHHHDGHQPRRLAVLRPRHPLGQLLQRR